MWPGILSGCPDLARCSTAGRWMLKWVTIQTGMLSRWSDEHFRLSETRLWRVKYLTSTYLTWGSIWLSGCDYLCVAVAALCFSSFSGTAMTYFLHRGWWTFVWSINGHKNVFFPWCSIMDLQLLHVLICTCSNVGILCLSTGCLRIFGLRLRLFLFFLLHIYNLLHIYYISIMFSKHLKLHLKFSN